MMKYFDDYLWLKKTDFSKYRYIVFYGESGSGKSTYIEFLKKDNISLNKDYEIVDEIFNLNDYINFLKQVIHKKHSIIATHLWYLYFFPLIFFGKIAFFRIDTQKKKIENYLLYLGYTYSESSIERYINLFWATYTDIDIICEWQEEKDFDTILRNFLKYNTLKKTAEKE